MAAILGVSGTNGGRRGAVADTAGLRDYTLDLLSGRRDGGDLFDRIEGAAFPRSVSLVINNECNLACRHCYLQVDSMSRERLTAEEWFVVLDRLSRQPTDLVVIAGKEPLLGQTGRSVLRRLGELRAGGWQVRTGAITNGTLLDRHWDVVELAQLSYLDISVDGAEVEHDAVRGKGAFAQAADNIRTATARFGESVFATMTIHAGNVWRLEQAFQAAHDLGFATVGCSFYHPLPYTDPALTLTAQDYTRLFASWHQLESLRLFQPLTVHLDLGETAPEAQAAFLASGWCDPDGWELDANGSVYNEYRLANGLRLQFRLTVWPQPLREVARISVDGHLLLAIDSLNTRGYGERSLANLRDHEFDLAAAHEAALASPRRLQSMTEYAQSILPKLRASFQGRVTRTPVGEASCSAA